MFLTQIIGCIVAALVVAVLWLGMELRGVKRDIDRSRDLDELIGKAADAERALAQLKYERMWGRGDS